MATYIPYQGALDPLGQALGSMGPALALGILQGQQQKNLMSDQSALIQYLAQMQNAQQTGTQAGQMAGTVLGGPVGSSVGSALGTAMPMESMVQPPTMKTPKGQQMLMELQLGHMLNPLQKAQMAYYDAQSEEARANAQRLITPEQIKFEKTDPRYYLQQGYDIDDARKAANIAAGLSLGPQAPKTYEPIMLHNPQTGEQVEWTPGSAIPEGGPWQKVGSGPSTVVNVGTGGKITPATQTKIEEQVVMDSNFAKSLSDLGEGYRKEYFDIEPNIESWLYNNLTGKVRSIRDTIPGQTQEFYAEMEAFKSQANQVFNEYRKVITGAQAGMPEIMFLRKSVPTTNDSPEVFKSKAKVAQAFFSRRAQLYQEALASDNPLAVIAGGQKINQQVAKEIADQIKAGSFGEDLKQAVGIGPKPIEQMSRSEMIDELVKAGVPIEQIREAIAEEERRNAKPNP